MPTDSICMMMSWRNVAAVKGSTHGNIAGILSMPRTAVVGEP